MRHKFISNTVHDDYVPHKSVSTGAVPLIKFILRCQTRFHSHSRYWRCRADQWPIEHSTVFSDQLGGRVAKYKQPSNVLRSISYQERHKHWWAEWPPLVHTFSYLCMCLIDDMKSYLLSFVPLQCTCTVSVCQWLPLIKLVNSSVCQLGFEIWFRPVKQRFCYSTVPSIY